MGFSTRPWQHRGWHSDLLLAPRAVRSYESAAPLISGRTTYRPAQSNCAGTKYGIFASSRNGRDAGIVDARGKLHRDFWIYCSNPWNLR